jgi:chromosome segregation ATPase
MDAYKAVEDGYHELLLVHSEKRKIIQDLLESIHTLQAEAVQIEEETKRTLFVDLVRAEHEVMMKKQQYALLKMEEDDLQKELAEAEKERDSVQKEIDAKQKLVAKMVREHIQVTMPGYDRQIADLASKKHKFTLDEKNAETQQKELDVSIAELKKKIAEEEAILANMREKNECLREAHFDQEVILQDIERQTKLMKSKNVSPADTANHVARLVKEKADLEARKAQLKEDLDRAIKEKEEQSKQLFHVHSVITRRAHTTKDTEPSVAKKEEICSPGATPSSTTSSDVETFASSASNSSAGDFVDADGFL